MNFDVKEDDNNDDGEIYTKPKMSAPIGKTFVDTKSLVSLRLEAYKTATFDNVGSITYDHFFNNYLIPNIPCIFTNRVTESWKSRKLWRDVNNSPAFEYLRSEFGNYHSFTFLSVQASFDVLCCEMLNVTNAASIYYIPSYWAINAFNFKQTCSAN